MSDYQVIRRESTKIHAQGSRTSHSVEVLSLGETVQLITCTSRSEAQSTARRWAKRCGCKIAVSRSARGVQFAHQ